MFSCVHVATSFSTSYYYLGSEVVRAWFLHCARAQLVPARWHFYKLKSETRILTDSSVLKKNWSSSSRTPRREAGGFLMPPLPPHPPPPVWNFRAVSLIPLFYISSFVLLPSPVALCIWHIFLNSFSLSLHYPKGRLFLCGSCLLFCLSG